MLEKDTITFLRELSALLSKHTAELTSEVAVTIGEDRIIVKSTDMGSLTVRDNDFYFVAELEGN